MQLELSKDEALFLKVQLNRHLGELDDELIHTDKRLLQRELAKDAERLRNLEQRLSHLIELRGS